MSSASAPLPLASTPKCSIPVSPVANWTIPSSAIFRPAPIPAAKTASSTPSSSMAPFFNLPSPFEREKLSTAMASYSAIYCRKWRKHQNERRNLSKENLLYRTLLALVLIILAAALRIAPHPWNFTPVGAMALFSGAVLKDRRLAFLFPLLALFAGDLFIGFHKLMPIVYASFLVNVAIGLFLRHRRTVSRVAGATSLGAIQFFLFTNFGVWWLGGFYLKTTM